MLPKRVVDYLVYLLVRVFICIIQAMRIESCERLAGWLATLMASLLKVRRQVVDENLRHAFPDMAAGHRRLVAWKMWQHLFLMAFEIAHAPRKIHETNWRDFFTLRNSRPLVAALLDDRPSVLVSAHFGNFEIAGYMLGIFGMPTFTVARPLDNPYLDRFLNDFRGATGQQILPKRGTSGDISKLLECNGALLLLGDQASGPKGCWVDFFHRTASVHKAIAVFSLSNDAPLVVTLSRRLDRPLRFEIGTDAIADPRDGRRETANVRELTEWFTRQLENTIRTAPDQYWWLHRRWKGKPRSKARRQERKAA
ncbi:MAG: lysophospholipid acyltransferase family protein [Planctomycetes bacterium]|nr:lysophospholipid acyltransferase family protein [Planctomycetota bacterium]